MCAGRTQVQYERCDGVATGKTQLVVGTKEGEWGEWDHGNLSEICVGNYAKRTKTCTDNVWKNHFLKEETKEGKKQGEWGEWDHGDPSEICIGNKTSQKLICNDVFGENILDEHHKDGTKDGEWEDWSPANPELLCEGQPATRKKLCTDVLKTNVVVDTRNDTGKKPYTGNWTPWDPSEASTRCNNDVTNKAVSCTDATGTHTKIAGTVKGTQTTKVTWSPWDPARKAFKCATESTTVTTSCGRNTPTTEEVFGTKTTGSCCQVVDWEPSPKLTPSQICRGKSKTYTPITAPVQNCASPVTVYGTQPVTSWDDIPSNHCLGDSFVKNSVNCVGTTTTDIGSDNSPTCVFLECSINKLTWRRCDEGVIKMPFEKTPLYVRVNNGHSSYVTKWIVDEGDPSVPNSMSDKIVPTIKSQADGSVFTFPGAGVEGLELEMHHEGNGKFGKKKFYNLRAKAVGYTPNFTNIELKYIRPVVIEI